ncbi:hypothetical protein [Pelodictyon phaeoclathratiforme]|uniref:hypothetical protein n=1 Tax=Pelodictyon phaeoclathratiforme TaxID=34090 RepID=UPI001CBB9516|nr:hypothetical protein [Pelodictyon phaeoclathratiforme]
MGSGTTALAAKNLERGSVGCTKSILSLSRLPGRRSTPVSPISCVRRTKKRSPKTHFWLQD